jgi:hypothetical protein
LPDAGGKLATVGRAVGLCHGRARVRGQESGRGGSGQAELKGRPPVEVLHCFLPVHPGAPDVAPGARIWYAAEGTVKGHIAGLCDAKPSRAHRDRQRSAARRGRTWCCTSGAGMVGTRPISTPACLLALRSRHVDFVVTPGRTGGVASNPNSG